MQLIVLAAGKGSRLPKKFRQQPKCLTKINGTSLLKKNLIFFNYFKKRIIVGGYKKNLLQKITKENNFELVVNKRYRTTNMVESLFVPYKKISKDIVVCYGDVIFNHTLYNILNKSGNIMPVYTKWYQLWSKRMKKKYIPDDAENLISKGNVLQSIGGKIHKKKPKFQYMGVFKLTQRSYLNMYKYYKKINNNKIDMTSFINECLLNKIIKFKITKYEDYWFEIDNLNDIKVTEKNLKW